MEGNMAEPAETTEDAASGETMENEGGTAASTSSKTFTQAEIDAVVEQRLSRERKKFANYDELRAKAEAHDKATAASQSELEKERSAREKAEAAVAASKLERDNDRMESALLREAAKAGVKNTDVVLRAVDKSGLTIGDDGQVSGAAAAVKALLTEIPALVGSAGSADQGARGGSTAQITADQLDKMSAEEITKATDEGRLDHLLKG